MPVKVQKKDGRLEDFQRAKVVAGVMKSGADFDQAQEVGRQVEAWVGGAAVNGVITSEAIRQKVLEVLRAVNPTAAAAFEAYRKPEQTPPEMPPGGGQTPPMEGGGIPPSGGQMPPGGAQQPPSTPPVA